ncbi:hypothetical protein, partial [Burkholderia ubonensis]|uniref:hypothetical protein n=1 Tax=Burkholderia ubonensis TaxID=101571 RepID=UPI001E433E8D
TDSTTASPSCLTRARMEDWPSRAAYAESVSIFRDQIIEYRPEVAKASNKKEVAGAGAMMMATDGAAFDADSLYAIKENREFCIKYDRDGDECTIKRGDFAALGVCIASSIAMQMLSGKIDKEIDCIKEIVNSSKGFEEDGRIYRSLFSLSSTGLRASQSCRMKF